MLLLTWDEALVPAEGSEVVCGTAPLAKSVKKDAAGIAFHKKCLASVGHTGTVSRSRFLFSMIVWNSTLCTMVLSCWVRAAS